MSYDKLAESVDLLAVSTTSLTEQSLLTQTAADSAKDTAVNKADVATNAANIAVASKDVAVSAETSASASKTSATASAATASTRATEAAASATAAKASQTAAKTSETNAGVSAASAAVALVATARFCGVFAVAPTTRLNGDPLQQADEYQNSNDKLRYSWSGTAWVALNSSAQELAAKLAAPTGGTEVFVLAPLAQAIPRTVTDKLGEHISLLDLVPKGTDLWNTDLTPWVQFGVTAYGVLELPKGNLRINGPVYVRSDREIPGMGCTFGGTVVRSSLPGPVFIGGSASSPVHTRVSITNIKFVCDNLTDRTKFTLSFLSGFMNEFHNITFGDISGVGNQQNGLEISGTAHWVGNIRGIGMAPEAGLEDTTGILLRSTRGTNSYSNLQAETTGKIVMNGERNSRYFGTHSERSNWSFTNCSWNLRAGGYLIDGVDTKDSRSAGNTTLNIGGANGRANDIGLFNKYVSCATSMASHGALEYGIGDSYLKETVIATAWDSPAPHKAYKLPAAGWYIALVLCKNTYQNGALDTIQSGTVQVYNTTTAAVLASQAYSIQNNSGIVGAQANSGNATQTVILCFQGAANDNIVIREPSDDRSRSGIIKVFMSPVENVNPLLLNGSYWGVSGAPTIPGESAQGTVTNHVPVFADGVYQMPLDGTRVFGLTQRFKPRTAAELYAVIVKGTWTAGALRVNPYSGNAGERASIVSQNLDILGEDNKRYLVQYIDGRALHTAENMTRIAVGSTLAPPAQTITLDMLAVFPVR